MSIEQNKMIARRFYEVFNAGNLDGLGEIVAADVVDHNPAPGQGPGLAGLQQVLGMFRTGFPDMQVTVEDLVAEGDRVLVRNRAQGTHNGAFLGIPPTGKPVDFAAMDLYRMADGKIVEAWHLEDLLTMMMQVGAMQPPGG